MQKVYEKEQRERKQFKYISPNPMLLIQDKRVDSFVVSVTMSRWQDSCTLVKALGDLSSARIKDGDGPTGASLNRSRKRLPGNKLLLRS